MKKIILLITISLLFSGNAYTNEEIDKALEKCADTQIAYGNIKNIDKSYYEDNEIYKIMLSEKNSLQLKADEAGDIFTKSYKQYWADNPRPKYPTRENIANYNFDDYRKASDEYEKKETAYLKPFKDKMLNLDKEVKKQELLVKETISMLVRKKIGTLTIQEKARSIKNYTKKFTLCESAHGKTPRSFMLEWG